MFYYFYICTQCLNSSLTYIPTAVRRSDPKRGKRVKIKNFLQSIKFYFWQGSNRRLFFTFSHSLDPWVLHNLYSFIISMLFLGQAQLTLKIQKAGYAYPRLPRISALSVQCCIMGACRRMRSIRSYVHTTNLEIFFFQTSVNYISINNIKVK